MESKGANGGAQQGGLPPRRARRTAGRRAAAGSREGSGSSEAAGFGEAREEVAASEEAVQAGPGAWVRGPELAVRLALGLALVAALVWLLHRGPLLAPVSLFSSVTSTDGFYAATHIVAAMALVAACGLCWPVLSRRGTLPSPLLALALALPLAAVAYASVHAIYPHDAATDLEIACAMALFFCGLVVAIGSGRGVLAALAVLAGVGVWLAVLALVQYRGGQPTPVAWTGSALAAAIPVRVSATLHNPNALGAALVLTLCGAAALAISARALPLAIAAYLALVPIAAALPLTFSRGAYLGLAAAVITSAVLLPRGRRLRGLIALIVVAGAIAVVAVRVPGVGLRVGSMQLSAVGGDVQSRYFTWADALAVFRARPNIGVGPGGLNALYARHQPAPPAGAGAPGTYVLIAVPGSADNDALQWLAETGRLGGGALAAGLILALVSFGLGLRRRGRDAQAAGAVLLACLAATAVQGVLEVTAYVLPLQGLLALVLAALAGLSGQARPARPALLGRVPALALAVGGVVLAGLLAAPWPAEQALAAGWSALSAGASAASALPDLEAALAADPGSARDAGAAGDAAVQAAYAAATGRGLPSAQSAVAGTDLGIALNTDPFDGDTWSAVAALLRASGPDLATACAQQAAVIDFPYSPWYATQLASDLAAIDQPAAAQADAGYAAWIFPLQIAIYAEHDGGGQTYAQQAQADLASDRAQWGAGPLPQQPSLPLTQAACLPALAAAGIPAGAYARAAAGI